ncbi:FMN-dependent NADH-azoreductase [Pendulispora albinea]|uniref:FMN dependent NADH:quinone oxidoreductase n=1 Tax=Pendulispora albinea TaxID=2741071 RepID=A0ABZ2LW29_9BACT
MANLLYVEASPNKQRSVSIEVSRAFLATYAESNPGDAVHELDIWAADLPPFDQHALEAKYAGLAGVDRTDAQNAAWRVLEQLAAPFLTADKFLLGIPLWNFSIPYRLKHLIDLVSQKDILFSFDERGFSGRVKAKKAAVIYARGLDYAPTSAWTPGESYDFQRPYIEAWLRFIGVTEIHSVVVERTLFGPGIDRESRAKGRLEAENLARYF